MKKLLLLSLVLVMSLALFACGGETNDTTLPADIGEVTQAPDDSGAHTHTYVETISVVPTCTSLGKKANVCACGEVEEGSEMPLPFAEHDAKAATCTEDSACATCGKVLVEKYGHLYVDSVVTEATCTTDGVAKSTCYRCGDSSQTVVAASHDFDASSITVSKGTVSSTCTKCGVSAAFEEKSTILKLDFDSDAEFANFPQFTVTRPDKEMVYSNSTLQTNGALWFKYQSSVIPQNAKLLLSLDFKMTAEGLTHRGESIFTFVAGRSAYNWLVKYYQADGVLSVVDTGHNSTNSMPASLNKWYNLVALIDTSTNVASIYVDGIYLGDKTIPNQYDAKYNNNFELRFFDVYSNGISMPVYDNFKLVELK